MGDSHNLFAGLDVSTQSCKLLVIDLDRGMTCYLTTVKYDHDLPQYRTENGVRQGTSLGTSESDPHMWADAIHQSFERLSKEEPGIAPQIQGISVSGQQHGLVTLTPEGDLSRPYSKLWNDFSTGEECALLTQAIGGPAKMVGSVGNTQRTGYTAGKVFHMVRNEPENYQNTATVFLVHNYINWVLTGGKEGGVTSMEPGDASGSGLWDPVRRGWAEDVISLIAPDLLEKLPPVKESRELLGPIGTEFVEKYHFSPGCQVASGSGDNMMGAIGTGNYREGVVTISLGTSGTAYTFMKKPFVDPRGEIACFCDATGNYLPLLCISNMANGYDAIVKEFGLTHDEFDTVIHSTSPGNRGRVLCPWYDGERTPDLPDAAPVYFGFDLHDFNREVMCRAVLEGHVMNLYAGFRGLPVSPEEIRLTGGMSRSPVWRQTIADVFNSEVVPVEGEGAAMGAALHAAWSVKTGVPLEAIADPFIKIDEQARCSPNPTSAQVYARYYRLYDALSKRVRGVPAPDPFLLHKQFT